MPTGVALTSRSAAPSSPTSACTAVTSVLCPVSTPSSLTMVLTASTRAAEGATWSSIGMTAVLCGMETAAPRIGSPRMPATACARSVGAKAL